MKKKQPQAIWIENDDNIIGRFVLRYKWFIALIQQYGKVYDVKIIRRNKNNPRLEMFKENLNNLDEAKALCEYEIKRLYHSASY